MKFSVKNSANHVKVCLSGIFFLLNTCVFAQVTVTGSTGADGVYSALTNAGGAFEAINGTAQTGNNIVVTITGNSTIEDGSNSLNAGAWASLLIEPSGGAARTVSGAVTGNLIYLNGADNVTIDGMNAGGNSLTITNTAAGASSTVAFEADATNDTIRNCILSGATGSLGTIYFSTGAATGNDNNVISGNTIKAVGVVRPRYSIYSAGTSAAIDNSQITISNNNIVDYFSAASSSCGILIASNSSAWTITGNKFYQTGTRSMTGAATHRAINIITAAGVNYSITNNIIGYSSASGTGTTTYAGAVASTFRAIEITVGNATASEIQGNTITAISFTTTSGSAAAPGVFTGISVLAGAVNIGTTAGNTIGASTSTGAITVTSTTTNGYIAGIYATSSNSVNIQNNIIGSVMTGSGAAIGHTFYGINTAGTGNYSISGNMIGSAATSSSINIGSTTTTTGVCTFNGITNAATGTVSITSNTIQNNKTYGTAASVLRGINNTAVTAGTLSISANNIISCSNTGTGGVSGISNSAAAGTVNIYKNKLYLLQVDNAAGIISGILLSDGITVNTYNNLIGDLLSPSSALNDAIRGISITSATASSTYNVYYNTVYLNASSASGTFGTSGIYHAASATATTATLNLRNNLIVNLSTPSGTGLTVAHRRSGIDLANFAATSDNNSFYSGIPDPTRLIFYDGTNSDQTLAGYQTRVIPAEAASVTVNPDFLSTTGTEADFLHLETTGNCTLNSAAAPIAGYPDDYDGNSRSVTPDIGADEFTPVSPPPAPTVSGTTTICSGTSTTLTASGAVGAGFEWWDAVTGGASLGTSAVYNTPVLSANTTYWVEQSTACAGTSAPRTSVTVTVNNLPGTAGIISGTTPVCRSLSGVSYSAGAISDATSYTWAYSGSGATLSSNPSSSPAITIDFSSSATTGDLTVKGTNSCGDGTVSPVFSITFNTPPTAANAGSDQNVCTGAATLAGNTPASGTGLWSVVSGVAAITTPNSPASAVTGLATDGSSAILRWTISNAPCPSSYDEMRIICPPHTSATQCNGCHLTFNAPGVAITTVGGNANLCMSCHNPAGVAYLKQFNNSMKAIPGVSGTSHAWNKPAVNATYEATYPAEIEMLDRVMNDSIVCSTCHNQHDNTYQPYLRGYATANELCKDCHFTRNVGVYNDDTVINKGSHPVGRTYPVADSRFKAAPTDSVVLISGNVECTSCHKQHYAPIDNGYILRQANSNSLCQSCHTYTTHNGQGCLTCHTPHNTDKTNILMIRNTVTTPNSGAKAVAFAAKTGVNSFADGDITYNGICEVCHTATSYHRNDGSAITSHQAGNTCTNCHKHSNMFSPPACGDASCHPTTGGSWSSVGAHPTHVQRYGFACSTCHFQRGSLTAYHVNGTADINFDPNGLATRNGLDANIPAFNSGTKVCTNVYCHSNGRTAYRGTDGDYTWSLTTGSQAATYVATPNWTTGTFTSCDATACHDALNGWGFPAAPSYTVSSPGLIPAGATNYQPNSGTHRSANHTDNDQGLCSAVPAWNRVNCFWCHNTNGAACSDPNYEGTYGTAYHVDGQTYFKPLKWPNGTMGPWNERAYDGSTGHCAGTSSCW